MKWDLERQPPDAVAEDARRVARHAKGSPIYGPVTDRYLPRGAAAVDYLELAMAALDQVGVPLGPVVRALPDPQRWKVLSIAWVKRALETP